MAKQLPAVVKNFNVMVEGDSYAGLAKTITLPEIVKKTEEYRAAGMIGDVALDLGFEKLEMTITYTGIDTRHFEQLAGCGVSSVPIRFVGAYQRQDTCDMITRNIYMRGSVTNLPLGEISLGEINEQELTYAVTYLKVEDNNVNVLEIDVVNGIFNVMGKDKTSEINQALGL